MEKPPNQIIDQNIINQIITLSSEGKTQTEIAKILNVSQQSVSKYSNKPELRSVIEKLRDKLQKKHTTIFTARKIREENEALKLSNHAHNPKTIPNETIYQTPEQIEGYLARQDKSGLKIAKGTGILKTKIQNQTNIDNRIQTNISPEYLAFLMFQADNEAEIPDTEAEYIENQKSKENTEGGTDHVKRK